MTPLNNSQATVRGTALAHNQEKRGATPRPATNFGMATVDMASTPNAGREPRVGETHLRIVSASASQPETLPTESSLQERGGVIAWLVFHAVGVWASIFKHKPAIDEKEPCAWCQFEQAIKAQPHESHGICERHKQEMIADAKRFGKSQFA